MITYKQLFEAKDTGGHGSEKHHAMVFGRMNPITTGHEAVVNKMHEVAKEHNAGHSLVVSHSQDAKKNPLSSEQKVKHAKNAFPKTNVSASSKEKPTILHHAADLHKKGVTHLHVIAGSDRHKDMHELLHKYNDKESSHGHYNFKKITVHSSGERDPDSEGTEGISASKMREHAASGNKTEFHKGAPSTMSPKHKDAMYNDVRKGMNLKEETADQQDDRAKQLKRFKDQMMGTYSNKIKPEPLNKDEKQALHDVNEHLTHASGAHAWISDFVSSTHPRFNNKSKEERRKMAIGAYMNAKANAVKEEKTTGATKLVHTRTGANGAKYHIMQDSPTDYSIHREHEGKTRHIDTYGSLHRAKQVLDNEVKEAYQSHSGPSHGHAYGGTGFKRPPREDDEGWDRETKQADVPHAVHINGKKWKSFGSQSHATNVAKKIKGATVHKEEVELSENAPFKKLEHAVSYATDKVKTHRDNLDGIEVYKHKSGGYDVNHTMNSSGRDSLHKSGAKHLGTVYKDKPANIKEDVLDEVSSELLGRYKEKAKKSADELSSKGQYKKSTDRWSNVMKATGKQIEKTTAGIKKSLNKEETQIDEAMTGNPGKGYHGSCATPDDKYEDMHKHVKNLTDADDKTVKHYLDSGHGEKLAGKEDDHEHIKKDFKKFMKYYRPEMHNPKPAVKEEVEELDEKSDQARRNKTWKNLMATAKGAKINRDSGLNMKPGDTGHKNARDMNKALGRHALRGEFEEGTIQPSGGDAMNTTTSAPTQSTSKETTMGKKIKGFKFFAGENDKQMTMAQPVKEDIKDIAKKAFKALTGGSDEDQLKALQKRAGAPVTGKKPVKEESVDEQAPVAPVPPKKKEQMKSRVGHPTNRMSCEAAQKGVNVDNVNAAGQEPHEEKWEPAKKDVSKLKKVKENTMKTYKEFLQSLDEKLIGNQKKLDKNHNGKLDKQDFEMLRKEEAEELDEKLGGTQNMLNQTTHKSNDPMRRLKVTSDHPRFKNQPLNKTSQDILKKRLKSAQGTHSKPNLPEEVELEEDVSKMSTEKLKQHWDKHKDQSGASPVFAAQLKKVGKELAKRKALRNEEVEQLDEYESDSSGVYRHTKKATYGTSYNDPEGAFETKDDMKKKEKQAAGRKSGQSVGSYKRRQPKAAG